MRIDGTSALGPVGGWDEPGDQNVTTVRAGEGFLSDVAHRLGMEADSLRKANPHLSETAKLTPGKEVRVPLRAARNEDSEANSEKVK